MVYIIFPSKKCAARKFKRIRLQSSEAYVIALGNMSKRLKYFKRVSICTCSSYLRMWTIFANGFAVVVDFEHSPYQLWKIIVHDKKWCVRLTCVYNTTDKFGSPLLLASTSFVNLLGQGSAKPSNECQRGMQCLPSAALVRIWLAIIMRLVGKFVWMHQRGPLLDKKRNDTHMHHSLVRRG